MAFPVPDTVALLGALQTGHGGSVQMEEQAMVIQVLDILARLSTVGAVLGVGDFVPMFAPLMANQGPGIAQPDFADLALQSPQDQLLMYVPSMEPQVSQIHELFSTVPALVKLPPAGEILQQASSGH